MSTELPLNSNALPQVNEIVSSYLKRNRLSSDQIELFRTALQSVFSNYMPAPVSPDQTIRFKIEDVDMPETPEAQLTLAGLIKPVVPIENSIQPDFIICLEDGEPVRSLGKHLKTHALTPAQYRRKWNLPADYPMTAPNYTNKREKPVDEPTNMSSTNIILGESTIDAAQPASTIMTVQVDDEEQDPMTSNIIRDSDTAKSHTVVETPLNTDTARADISSNMQSAASESALPEDPAIRIQEPYRAPEKQTADKEIAAVSDQSQKPPQKLRSILKLAAWHPPADAKTIAQTPEAAPIQSEETSPDNGIEDLKKSSELPPREGSPKGFRYPVHRYSR